jgi:hypothetical protein
MHAGDRTRAILQQPPQAGGVADLDAEALGLLDELVDQAPAAADRLDVHPAVEVVLALDLERLPAEHREEAHALMAHPAHRVARAVDQQLGERVVGLALGHASQVVEVAVLAHHRQHDLARLGFGQVVEDVAAQVVEPLVHEAEAAGGEQRVAAALLERRLSQHQHLGRPLLLRGDRGA